MLGVEGLMIVLILLPQVGSKTLTLKQAVIVASVFEFCGAVLMGSHVTDAVYEKI